MTLARVWHRTQCVLFVVATAAAYGIPSAPVGARGASYVALHLLLTVLMFGAWATADAADTSWVLTAGVLARLVLVCSASFTTEDPARYLWDGRVALAGLDPYRVPPNAPALAGLRAAWGPVGPHPNLPTLYPPGGLALFAVAAGAGPVGGSWVWKGLVTAASLATLWVTARVLKAHERTRHLALIALSPLAVLEGGVGAHVDTVAALAVAVGLHYSRDVRGGVALGLGALAKLLPGTAVVPAAAAGGWRLGGRVVVGAGLTVTLGYAVAIALGLRPVGSLFVLLTSWHFGSPLGSALATAFGEGAARIWALGLLAAGLLFAAVVARAGKAALGVQVALAAPLLVSAVVYPWYLLPLVPAVTLAPSAVALGWLTAAPLTYEVLDRFDLTGAWMPAVWPLWGIAGAWLAGLITDIVRWTRARWARSVPGAGVPPGGLSVVIPVLDEEQRIGQRLVELAAMPGVTEVIVVDGGSADRTVTIARTFPRVRVVKAPRGRGVQLNAGARAARGTVLLFLHADVALPADAARWTTWTLADPAVVAGAFRTWTVVDACGAARHRWLRPLLRLADVRSRVTRLPYGDQALFVRREAFERIGGFPEQPFMEDLELARQLRRIGRIRTVPAAVRVSGRRFLAHPFRTVAMMRLFPLAYRLGVSPQRLARLYGDPR